jgi:uncharacterized protein (TIGR03067 family)
MRFIQSVAILGLCAVSVQSAPDRKPIAPPEEEPTPHLGKWRLIYAEFEGQEQTAEYPYQNTWVIDTQTIALWAKDKTGRLQSTGGWSYQLDQTKTPATLDLTSGVLYPSILKLEGDRLTVCIQNFPARGRPKDFTSTPGSGIGKYVYARMKPGE